MQQRSDASARAPLRVCSDGCTGRSSPRALASLVTDGAWPHSCHAHGRHGRHLLATARARSWLFYLASDPSTTRMCLDEPTERASMVALLDCSVCARPALHILRYRRAAAALLGATSVGTSPERAPLASTPLRVLVAGAAQQRGRGIHRSRLEQEVPLVRGINGRRRSLRLRALRDR